MSEKLVSCSLGVHTKAECDQCFKWFKGCKPVQEIFAWDKYVLEILNQKRNW